MKKYLPKTPAWMVELFPQGCVWKMEVQNNPAVYLTFDDGPHPEVTPFVLDELKNAGAKASFFAVGENVRKYPDVFRRILDDGHTVGNHTHDHLNGWRTTSRTYLKNIIKAAEFIPGRNFRPPYGRIKRQQAHVLLEANRSWTIYMWSVLSGDFDRNLSPETCFQNVAQHISPGAIVVFHDSEKAFPRLRYALPQTLRFCQQQHWEMKSLPK